MLEKLLSRKAFRIYIGVFIVLMGYVAWMRFTETGLILWIDWLQILVFKDHFYPEFSFLVLMILAMPICFGAGLLYDFLTHQGIFGIQAIPEDLDPGAFITYRQTTRADMIEKVRSKYAAPLHQLRELGFAEAGFYRESVERLGLKHGLFGLTGALGFLGNEVTSMGPNMTVSAYFPLMTFRDNSTFTSTFGLGTSFFTLFTDGTCLVSSNYHGTVIADAGQKIYKSPVSRSLPAAWEEHKQRIEQMCLQGKQIRDDLSFLSFAAMSRRIDEFVVHNKSRVQRASKSSPSIPSLVLSALGAMGILVGIVLAWFLPDTLIATLYPACGFVRNMKLMPLTTHILLTPLPFVFSWALSRFRHNDLLLMEGFGMQLYGEDQRPGTSQFLTTKWLAVPGVPLIPVRSYLMTIEDLGPGNREVVEMKPLPGIDWGQVRLTIRQSWWRYLILVLIFLAFPVWSLLECN